jgi:hypothetical protein
MLDDGPGKSQYKMELTNPPIILNLASRDLYAIEQGGYLLHNRDGERRALMSSSKEEADNGAERNH